jgi:hypothetical protein
VVALGLVGAGGAGVITGAIFGVLSLNQEARAKSILDAHDTGNISEDRRQRYNGSIDQRDAFRTVSIVAFSAGITLAAGGVLLWTFDKPSVAVVPPRSEPEPAPRAPGPSMEVGAYPILGPGVAGAGLGGRF